MTPSPIFSAFVRGKRLATGTLPEVLNVLGEGREARTALVFDEVTGDLVKLGNAVEIERALAGPEPMSREPVSASFDLLPRHVAWLESQPAGPSATVRRLIEAARRDGTGRQRQARDAAYRFLSMMAGDMPGFEEACRAVYAVDADRFEAATVDWPRDIRSYSRRLAGEGLR